MTSIRMTLPNPQAGTRPLRTSSLRRPVAVDGAVIFTPHGLIESVSPSLERVFGYSSRELIGRPVSVLIPSLSPHEEDGVPGRRMPPRPGGADGIFENSQGTHKDGFTFPIRVSVLEVDCAGRERFVAIIQDFTPFEEPVRSEALLRAAEARLSRLLNSGVAAIAFGDSQGRFRQVNDAFVQLTGYSREELLAPTMTWMSLLADASKRSASELLNEVLSCGAGRPSEQEYVRKDGTRIPVLFSGTTLPDAGGNRMVLVLDDLQRRRRELEQAAVPAEPDLGEMAVALANAVEGMARKDESGRYVTVNHSYARMFGSEPDEFGGRSWLAHVHASDHRAAEAAYERMRATGKAEFEGRAVRRNGTVFFVQALMSRVVDRDGTFLGHYCFVRDITERKECERRIAELGIQEQQRIGRELHDGLAQELAGLGYMARSLVRRLDGTDSAQTAADLGRGIQRALEEVRAIVKGLAPVEIDADGLKSALEELVTSLERRYGTPIHFRSRQIVPVENNSTATHLYRIAQEAASNAIQHARAKTIQVTLQSDRNQLMLAVRDDGIGYRPACGHNMGMGLQIMKHRASMIGAELDIGPALEGGTLVTCTLKQKE